MDYNNILKNLRSDKNEFVDRGKELEKSKLEELEKAKQGIEERYKKLQQDNYNIVSKKTEEVYNYSKLIEEKSTMSSKIFEVIAELISIFEGEEYVLEKLDYHKDKATPSVVWGTHMIMPKQVYENIKNPGYIRERYFHHLSKNVAMKIVGDWDGWHLPDEFSFYKADLMGRLDPQISFRNFPYIKTFVDYVINYRIENNIEELSFDDMQKLKEQFIVFNIETIVYKYTEQKEQRLRENAENINSEYEHKKKILKRIVKKIENKDKK